MRSGTTTDFRCKQCGALLARQEREGISIRRGDMQITVSGPAFTVSITCYRCGTLNVLASPSATTPAPASATAA